MSRFYCLGVLDPDEDPFGSETDSESSTSPESDAEPGMSPAIPTPKPDEPGMSADTSTLESDGGRNISPGTSASDSNAQPMTFSLWLPTEIQIKIVNYLFDDAKPKTNRRGEPIREVRPKPCVGILGAAQTCVWWREKLLPLILPNMFLTQHSVGALRHLPPAQREQVQYVKLTIELEDQSCCACLSASENGGKVAARAKAQELESRAALERVQRKKNRRATQAALQALFRGLSGLPSLHADGTKRGLRLEIALVCRKCKTEHTPPDAGHLGTKPRCIDSGRRWRLARAPVVKEFIMRQQTRYKLGPHIIAGIFRALTTVSSMLYEPWRFRPHEETYRRDSHFALLIRSLPRTIRRLTLPEDLGADHQRDLPIEHGPGGPRGLNAIEFCRHALQNVRPRLQMLSISHMIEAEHFFDGLNRDEHWWPALRTVHMTSRHMLPPSDLTQEGLERHMLGINFMLKRVAKSTMNYLPSIRKLVIWNGDVGAAGAFIFHIQRRWRKLENSAGGAWSLHASYRWRGTWELDFYDMTRWALVRLGQDFTDGNAVHEKVPQMLDGSAIDSRSTAIKMLGLTEAVTDTVLREEVM